jgi:hypothetical protein
MTYLQKVFFFTLVSKIAINKAIGIPINIIANEKERVFKKAF